ncbi:hypothetical protein [Streptomyces sp. NEAU-W12]|uniref:hypothetical protein n=1 Tax=Streptomyces sp. NEAU-W12 TaxID=2994668 RepID=UPI00224AF056|nr:hypothetical protein [Streptomyces sp. NEAU-W12]MCX2927978.1 hypothetical protein [Streptomyces sp. NEAU-W12]
MAPLCIHDGADFTGLLDNYPSIVPNPGDDKEDKISLIVNDSDYRFLFFSDIPYRGEVLEVGPHQTWVASAEWDNRISSCIGY